MLELCGWIGSLCLAFCALPQAIKSFKDGHANGLSWGLILLWLIGEIFGFIYTVGLGSLPLICNYGMNIILMLVILWFKLFPRK